MRLVRKLLLVALFILLLPAAQPVAAQSQPQLFSTERAAQAHCPAGTVVWLNTKSGVYHLKGQRWYGAIKQGAFACKKEVDAAGRRATRNGQYSGSRLGSGARK